MRKLRLFFLKDPKVRGLRCGCFRDQWQVGNTPTSEDSKNELPSAFLKRSTGGSARRKKKKASFMGRCIESDGTNRAGQSLDVRRYSKEA